MARAIDHAVVKTTEPQPDGGASDTNMANTTVMDSNPKAKALLLLPAEIRNRIYELVLVTRSPVTIRATKYHRASIKHVEPGLLLSCRQIRNECLKIHYERNTFHFFCAARYQPTLTDGRCRVHMMRKILVSVSDYCSYSLSFKLDLTEGLRNDSLQLVKLDGKIWDMSKDGFCSKSRPRKRGLKYLESYVTEDHSVVSLSAETLEHLILILSDWQKE